jgi:hypothetical protein
LRDNFGLGALLVLGGVYRGFLKGIFMAFGWSG